MEVVDKFPERIREVEHAWIPMSDGVRLSARIWLPERSDSAPVPAIFEYIPYRKRDGSRLRDETIHPYFAGHGYASIRVDIRGSGDSEGVLTDEYLQQELDDGVAIIEWLAGQKWCDGSVGMIGISWGGFNGLQIAQMGPPELKAVVTVCSTDDRYADDVHYMGGCLLGDNLSWASTMFSFNSLPPDPEIVGSSWRKMWFERLKYSGLWIENWLRHQHRDDYWKHGSICEDFSKIKVPVMAVSGWADGYSNAVFRLLEKLECPRLGLIGPWSHKYPHLGVPGPAVGFLDECLGWWDKWLKGKKASITEKPLLRAWMLESMPPSTHYHQRFGRWISEDQWPSKNIESKSYLLEEFHLKQKNEKVRPCRLKLQSPLSNGLLAGKWCSYSATPDLPHDQREEDGGALTFTSAPLEETMEILGAPELELELSSDRPNAMIAARLSDMRPDNKVARVTYGLLNLTHRDGHETPQPLEPGRFYKVRLKLNGIAQTFPKGHRIRLAISSSYFPLAWPSPESTRLEFKTEGCSLVLPVRTLRRSKEERVTFSKAMGSRPGKKRQLEKGEHNWLVSRDLAKDAGQLTVINDNGLIYFEDVDLTIKRFCKEWYSYEGDSFNSPNGKTLWIRGLERESWRIKTVAKTELSCDTEFFYIDAELDAYENGKRIFSKNWNRSIARKLV